jgi:hypothetical protein
MPPVAPLSSQVVRCVAVKATNCGTPAKKQDHAVPRALRLRFATMNFTMTELDRLLLDLKGV